MNTRYPKLVGCVPNLAGALKANALADHYQRNPMQVTLDSGVVVSTGHLHTDGRRFNFKDVYQTDYDWEYAYITQFSYTTSDGSTKVIDVAPRNPHPIAKGFNVTNFGYVTNIEGKRWGVMVELNWLKQTMQIVADPGSPITGVMIQFI